ncbi:MAG: DUF4397 domain-containing protein [Sphingobacteriaceae bacterium]
MKTLKQKFKTLGGLALGMLATSILLTSCLKKTDSEPAQNAALTVINASSGTDSLSFYFDNYLVNKKPLRYTEKIDYFQFYAGNHTLVITKPGSTKQIAGGYGGFNGGSYYTVFVVATGIDSTKLILKNDSVSNPTTGKAKIRFANLTYDSPEVNIGIEGQPALFSKAAFKKVTSFVEITPGTFNFTVQETANASAIKVVKQNIKIEADKIYTIWTKGLWTSATAANPYGIYVTGY